LNTSSLNEYGASPNKSVLSQSKSNKLGSAMQAVRGANKMLLSEKKMTNSSKATDVSSPYKLNNSKSLR